MAALRLTVLFACLLATGAPRPTNAEYKKTQADNKAKADQKAADEGKTAAVDKVIAMLTTLRGKVQAEGESEAASYNKFSCFCKTTQSDKTDAIQKGKDDKASLTANINKLATGRKTDDTTITGLEKDIKETNDKMDAAVKTNEGELKTYGEEKADLSSAIDAIQNALKTLKASKPSLLQLKSVSDTVRNAMAMADALGLGVDTLQGPAEAFLQQAPEVEMENYKGHSEGVIDTLEKLHGTFRDKKAKSDAAEVKRLSEHDLDMQTNTDIVTAKTLELGQTQKARDDKIAEIAGDSQKLSTTSADLLDDQDYLNELYKSCGQKAKSWDERSQVRSDELSALTAAITIIKGAVREKTSSSTLRFAQRGVSVRLAEAVARDDNAMEALEEVAEDKEASTAFLSIRRSVSRHSAEADNDPVDKISQLLKTVGGKTKSTLLSALAAQISMEKPKGMEKVKGLIEALIARLQKEAGSEATAKGFCDKSIAAAQRKQSTTGSDIDELNSNLAKLEADRELLTETLATLADEIKALKAAQTKADDMRKSEKTDNEASIKEAEEGKKAVESAITILEKFYKDAAKKESESDKTAKKVADDAPDGGFAGGEAYKGDQSAATGVLGMLDVITSDFDRTIKETKKAEAESLEDHTEFSDVTSTSLKEKGTAEKNRKKEKSDADTKFDSDSESLGKKTDLLVSTIEELLELKKTCVDSGMSYEERVERREQEVSALRKALCILSAYANYGPNAAEYDTCS